MVILIKIVPWFCNPYPPELELLLDEELEDELEDDELELLDDEELFPPELLDEEDELLLDELEDEELLLEELLELELLDDDPFNKSEPTAGRDVNKVPSILVPGEYLLTDFKNLSWATRLLKLKSPSLFKEIP